MNEPTQADGAPDDVELMEVTLDQGLEMAMKAHRARRFDTARTIYDAILQAAPDHPVALHFSGLLHQHEDHYEQALEQMARSVELAPMVPEFWNNYASSLFTQSRNEDALAAYDRALELDPDNAEILSNRGVLFRRTGLEAEAEASYRRALELNPKHAETHHNLGNLLMDRGREDEAITHLLRSFVLQPGNARNRQLMGYCHARLGDMDAAREVFVQWSQEEPDNPVPQHHLVALSGVAPERASDAYVTRTFDSFAKSFDEKLKMLKYRVPELIAADVAGLAAPAAGLDIIDAGCGTGLAAAGLRPFARTLTGVDLSAGMLAEAEKLGLYDGLEAGELTAWLQARPASADLIVSGDTLCYFGDLSPPLAAASGALRPGGRVIFTVERNVASEAPYHIYVHGRFGHSEAFVREALAQAGLTVELLDPVDLRMESGDPVRGFLVRAIKG